MSTNTRIPEYLYQYKTISMVNQFASASFLGGATGYAGVEITLPPNFIKLKNVWLHLVMSFNASEPTGNQKVVGLTFTGYPAGGSTFVTQVPLMWTPTGGYIDQKIDLTQFISLIPIQSATGNFPAAFIVAPVYPKLSFNATINLCKVDFIYTTQATL